MPTRSTVSTGKWDDDAMGLMILAGAETSLVLTFLLVATVGLTVWEAYEQDFDRKTLTWWVLLVLLIHVIGYVALRVVVASRAKGDRA